MKEATTVYTIQITKIYKESEMEDDFPRNYNEELQRGIASELQAMTEADDVQIIDIKEFFRDE